jgi:hypothetical protein
MTCHLFSGALNYDRKWLKYVQASFVMENKPSLKVKTLPFGILPTKSIIKNLTVEHQDYARTGASSPLARSVINPTLARLFLTSLSLLSDLA